MATASKFTKVSIIQSWSLEEAKAMMTFLERVSPTAYLSSEEEMHTVAVYQSLKKAMDNGRN